MLVVLFWRGWRAGRGRGGVLAARRISSIYQMLVHVVVLRLLQFGAELRVLRTVFIETVVFYSFVCWRFLLGGRWGAGR